MPCAQEERPLKATFQQRCDAIKCLEVRYDEDVSLVTGLERFCGQRESRYHTKANATFSCCMSIGLSDREVDRHGCGVH